jgi:hypothetical protein
MLKRGLVSDVDVVGTLQIPTPHDARRGQNEKPAHLCQISAIDIEVVRQGLSHSWQTADSGTI